MTRAGIVATVGMCAGLIASAAPARAQVGTYTIDSRDPNSVFEIALVPGRWSIAPTDGAWNAWNSVYGCDASGANCRAGWLSGYVWSLNNGRENWVGYQRYETPELALASAPDPVSVGVAQAASLQLRIGDQPGSYADNTGSLSLSVSFAEGLPSRVAGPGSYTIDARDPFSIFEVALTPGVWSVATTGGAWSAWSSVHGCNASGSGCERGWMSAFTWSLAGGPEQRHGRAVFATPELALANAPANLSLSVSEATTLRLRIVDHPLSYVDNQGSLTLTVAQTGTVTPEPASMILLGSGMLGLAAARRRRHR